MRMLCLVLTLAALPVSRCPADNQPALDTVQFDLVLGRLVAYSSFYHETKTSAVTNNHGDIREVLRMNVKQGVADVHYEMVEGGNIWTIDVVQGREVTIETQSGGDRFVRLYQPRSGKVALLVRDNGQHNDYAADSVWHLALTHPQACREHVFPMLELLRPGLPIEALLAKVEAELARWAENEKPIGRTEVSQLVRQLRSNSFVERQAADRQLREIGLATLPYLTRLNVRLLDAEQRLRIERMVDDITWQRADSPARVAQWLINDPSVWLGLLRRDDPGTSAIAMEQLERLGVK